MENAFQLSKYTFIIRRDGSLVISRLPDAECPDDGLAEPVRISGPGTVALIALAEAYEKDHAEVRKWKHISDALFMWRAFWASRGFAGGERKFERACNALAGRSDDVAGGVWDQIMAGEKPAFPEFTYADAEAMTVAQVRAASTSWAGETGDPYAVLPNNKQNRIAWEEVGGPTPATTTMLASIESALQQEVPGLENVAAVARRVMQHLARRVGGLKIVPRAEPPHNADNKDVSEQLANDINRALDMDLRADVVPEPKARRPTPTRLERVVSAIEAVFSNELNHTQESNTLALLAATALEKEGLLADPNDAGLFNGIKGIAKEFSDRLGASSVFSRPSLPTDAAPDQPDGEYERAKNSMAVATANHVFSNHDLHHTLNVQTHYPPEAIANKHLLCFPRRFDYKKATDPGHDLPGAWGVWDNSLQTVFTKCWALKGNNTSPITFDSQAAAQGEADAMNVGRILVPAATAKPAGERVAYDDMQPYEIAQLIPNELRRNAHTIIIDNVVVKDRHGVWPAPVPKYLELVARLHGIEAAADKIGADVLDLLDETQDDETQDYEYLGRELVARIVKRTQAKMRRDELGVVLEWGAKVLGPQDTLLLRIPNNVNSDSIVRNVRKFQEKHQPLIYRILMCGHDAFMDVASGQLVDGLVGDWLKGAPNRTLTGLQEIIRTSLERQLAGATLGTLASLVRALDGTADFLASPAMHPMLTAGDHPPELARLLRCVCEAQDALSLGDAKLWETKGDKVPRYEATKRKNYIPKGFEFTTMQHLDRISLDSPGAKEALNDFVDRIKDGCPPVSKPQGLPPAPPAEDAEEGSGDADGPAAPNSDAAKLLVWQKLVDVVNQIATEINKSPNSPDWMRGEKPLEDGDVANMLMAALISFAQGMGTNVKLENYMDLVPLPIDVLDQWLRAAKSGAPTDALWAATDVLEKAIRDAYAGTGLVVGVLQQIQRDAAMVDVTMQVRWPAAVAEALKAGERISLEDFPPHNKRAQPWPEPQADVPVTDQPPTKE